MPGPFTGYAHLDANGNVEVTEFLGDSVGVLATVTVI